MYKFALALRFLTRRRIAWISVIAISFGLMAMIVVNAVMDGFQLRIRESIYRVDGALVIGMKGERERNAPDHFENVSRLLEPWMVENGGPIRALSKRRSHPVVVSTTAGEAPGARVEPRSEFVELLGIDVDLERRVLPLDAMLDAVDGEGDEQRRMPDWARERPFVHAPPGRPISPDPGIMLGNRLAARLGLWVGDRLTVVTVAAPAPGQPLDELEPITRRFVLTGCFSSGRYEFDNGTAFCDGEVLQRFLDLSNDGDVVIAALVDPDRAGRVRDEILGALGGDAAPVHVRSWEDRMRSFAEALAFEKLAMLIVLACIVIVAGASICGILYMVVLEKTRDIGILLSMGATARGVVGLFLIYGGLLGLIGSTLGVVLGLEVVENLDAIIGFLEKLFGVDLFPPEVYEFRSLPTYYEFSEVVTLGLVTFSWCVFSSLLPALRAARLDPVKCLSYE